MLSDSNENAQTSTPTGTPRVKNAVSLETFIFIGIMVLIFTGFSVKMGAVNMMNTMMQTAYSLLLDTVLYITAIAVLAGALSGLLSEFGVISLVNRMLSPLMKPLYGMPGAATLGIVTCYLSDNPAILTLAEDHNFRRYFKRYQLPALTNIGTAFGMGMIITTFMIGIPSEDGSGYGLAALAGNLGAVLGSVVSARLMLHATAKIYGKTEDCVETSDSSSLSFSHRIIREGNAAQRAIDAMLTGGKSGVEVGVTIIPGVLVICTIIMMLSNGPSADGTYTGAAYEGIALLPWIGQKLEFILSPLFGFSDPSAIAVPITALGAAGAAISLVPKMVADGLAHGNDIAVFTAMCMCWSGYLSTHVAMMDGLKCRNLVGKAILCHTIGGLVAGVCARWIYALFMLF